MYSCVKLIEDGEKKIMTVPSKWVMEDVVYWPPNKFLEAKFFKCCADPQEDWLQFPIDSEIFQGSKEECDGISSGTECESQEEQIKEPPIKFVSDLVVKKTNKLSSYPKLKDSLKRTKKSSEKNSKKQKKRHYQFPDEEEDSNEEEDCDEDEETPNIVEESPEYNLKNLKKKNSNVSISLPGSFKPNFSSSPKNPERISHPFGSTSNWSPKSIAKTPNRVTPLGSFHNTKSFSTITKRTQENENIDMEIERSMDKRMAKMEANLKEVMNRQNGLMTMMIKIHDLLKCQQPMDSEQILKIDGIDDFDSAELALNDAETRIKLIDQLKRVGGLTYTIMVNGIINRLFTIQFQGKCNLEGKNGKFAIAVDKKKIYNLIISAVTQVHPNTDNNKVRNAIAAKLKNAPAAKGGVGRKKPAED